MEIKSKLLEVAAAELICCAQHTINTKRIQSGKNDASNEQKIKCSSKAEENDEKKECVMQKRRNYTQQNLW